METNKTRPRWRRAGRFARRVYESIGFVDTTFALPALWDSVAKVSLGVAAVLAGIGSWVAGWHPFFWFASAILVLVAVPWIIAGLRHWVAAGGKVQKQVEPEEAQPSTEEKEAPSIAAARRHREEARRTVALAVVEHYNGLILGKPDAGSRLHSAAKIAWKHWLTPEEKDSKSVINRAFAVIATAHHDSDFTVTDKLTGAVRDFTEVWPPARTMMLPATVQASDDAPDTKPDPPANPFHVETLKRLGGLWVDADQVLLQVVERGIDRAQSDPLLLLYELFERSAMSGHVGKWNWWEKLLARLGEDAKQSAVDEAISELWDSVRLYCRLWFYSKRLSYSHALISDEAWVTEQGQLAEARATRLADALRDTQHTSLERLAELAPHVDAAVMGEVPTT